VPEPPNPPTAAPAKPEPVASPVAKAPPQQIARVEPKAEPAPAPAAKAEPSKAPVEVARVEPKPEPAPPAPAAKAETPKPPVEVARVEPKAAAPSPQPSPLNGRYTGRLMNEGTPVAVTLQIVSAADGAVSGTASQSGGRCTGDYRMTGTVLGDALRMRSTHAGGRYGDCSFGFRASVQGTKLTGQTSNGAPIELSR
jgi:hypothetical protein